jgi:hypothetical protein
VTTDAEGYDHELIALADRVSTPGDLVAEARALKDAFALQPDQIRTGPLLGELADLIEELNRKVSSAQQGWDGSSAAWGAVHDHPSIVFDKGLSLLENTLTTLTALQTRADTAEAQLAAGAD